MAPLAGYAIARFSPRTIRTGRVEWRRTLCAEPGFEWVFGSALSTSVLERSCALDAELRTLRIFAEQFLQTIDLQVDRSVRASCITRSWERIAVQSRASARYVQLHTIV